MSARARAERLVLAAAAELSGDAVLTADPDRWRDEAVLLAAALAWRSGDARGVRALAAGYDRLLRRRLEPGDGGVRLVSAPVAERRRLGAFATSPGAAADLAALAVADDAGDAADAVSVCDPACGAGALLRAALARLTALGAAPDEAVSLLHGVDVDPVAVALARTVLAVDVEEAGGRCRPADLTGRLLVGDALTGPTPSRPAADPAGVAWHTAFPDVLDVDGRAGEPVTGWRGGFAAVVANPPWERLKLLAGEHAAAPAQVVRARRSAVRGSARGLREAGRHPLTAAGELNAYQLFAETCWRLLRPGGRAALLAPVGFASDASAGPLLAELTARGALERLQVRRNGAGAAAVVEDLPARQDVVLAVLRGRGGDRPARVTVGGGRPWRLDGGLLTTVNPASRTVPLCGGPADARLLREVHERVGVLLRRTPGGEPVEDPWRVRLRTPVHLTRDRRHLATRPGEHLVPLWEAKLAGLLDHRCATWTPRGIRPATAVEAADPRWEPTTRWWAPEGLVAHRLDGLLERGWLLGFRNTTMASAARTLLPCALPAVGVANSLPLLGAERLPLLLAALSSLPLDWAARQKVGGANLSLYKLEQLPVPPPSAYDVPAPWAPGATVGEWVTRRLADAVAWSAALAPLAAELGLDDVPPRPDPARRAAALADLDAVHARLLGLTRAELEHVLGSFGALRAAEVAGCGRYVTGERALAAFDALAEVAAA